MVIVILFDMFNKSKIYHKYQFTSNTINPINVMTTYFLVKITLKYN